MRRWGVLISGRGSNLGALIDAREANFDLRLVLSSDPNAYGLLRAKRAGVMTGVTPFIPAGGRKIGQKTGQKTGKAQKIDWDALDQRLRQSGITHLFLAGFMKIVPPTFIEKWRGKILNLHPSLLPTYPGLKSIEKAHAAGARLGLTVHEVNEEVDAGRIVCQRRTNVEKLSLADAEFLVHVDEQRAVKEAVERWNT